MLFVIHCIDAPEGAALRDKMRPDHVVHVRSQPVAVKLAGPLLDGAGAPVGSMVVIEAEDLATAKAFVQADPYNQAGVYRRYEIHAWGVPASKLA